MALFRLARGRPDRPLCMHARAVRNFAGELWTVENYAGQVPRVRDSHDLACVRRSRARARIPSTYSAAMKP